MTGSDALAEHLDAAIERVGGEVDGRAREGLMAWLALHERWSRAFNLTGTRDPERLIDEHLMDAVAVRPLLPAGDLLDVGSGSGLPGLVLAILEPQRRFVLVDSSGKRCRFLEQVVLELDLAHVQVVPGRIEDLAPGTADVDHLLARAVAPLPRLVAACRAHLEAPRTHAPGDAAGGGTRARAEHPARTLLAMKGPAWADEAAGLDGSRWRVQARPYVLRLPAEVREPVLVTVAAEREGITGNA